MIDKASTVILRAVLADAAIVSRVIQAGRCVRGAAGALRGAVVGSTWAACWRGAEEGGEGVRHAALAGVAACGAAFDGRDGALRPRSELHYVTLHNVITLRNVLRWPPAP